MAGESRLTTDHEVIRRWAEERGGRPATVRGTGAEGRPGILRLYFPDYSTSRSLEEVSWDEFFRKFEESHLAFLYQEQTRDNHQSRFFKFIRR